MIDCISFRIRIGCFFSFKSSFKSNYSSSKSQHKTQQFLPELKNQNNSKCTIAFLLYYLTIIYTSALILCMSITKESSINMEQSIRSSIFVPDQMNYFVPELLIYLLTIVIYRCGKIKPGRLTPSKLYRVIRYRYDIYSTISYKHFRRYVVWIACSNFILLTFSNMSIINPGPANHLNVMYQNVQGLIPFAELGNESPAFNQTKVFEFQAHVYKNSPDIIVLNETWLKNGINDNELFPPEAYKIFRCDRSPDSHPPDPSYPNKYRRNGGGVLIAIKSSLDITTKKISTPCPAEVLSIEITLKNKTKFCLSTIYRVGTLGMENLSALKCYYTNILKTKKYSKLFIIGDLNLPDLSAHEWRTGNCTNTISQAFLELFNDLGLVQTIQEPTHQHGNILDVLLTNSPQSLSNIIVGDENSVCKSDHFPINFNILANVRRKRPVKREIYNFKKADWAKLNLELSNIPWHSLLSDCSIEVCWQNFKTIFHQACDNHIPKINVRDGFKPPWFDSEVFESCREKERLRIKLKVTKKRHAENNLGNPGVKNLATLQELLDAEVKFQASRREVRRLIRSKMNSNFSDKQSENAITKKFWSYVKSSSNTHRIPETVHHNDTFRVDYKGQANLFNNFFRDQFSSPSKYDIQINYSGNHDISFSVPQIEKFLKNLDPNKAPGPDRIHGKILKNCAKNLAIPLALLYQTSYYTCSIPREWKLANVVPVFKKGSKNAVQNYRPISLTSLVMKVYERVIAAELLSIVESKIEPRQHGFLPLKSCESQLIPFTDSLARCLNRGSRTDIIYFDFAKAFDSVNHDIILDKLKNQYGINGLLLKFFVEYLSSRVQRVVIGNELSEELPVASGVPQGSILGPLLFVLFINDIGNDINKGSSLLLYADDTKLFREISNDHDCLLLQQDINTLNNWATANKMKFHPDKCKVLSVSLQRSNRDPFPYKLSGVPLQHVNSEKDLGVHIASNLCWTNHCNHLLYKASRNLGLLRRTCNFVKNTRQRRSLYIAMVRSQFEHCSSIWSSCSSTTLDKFESLQKRGIKWILGEEFLSYPEEIYYNKCKRLDILPIKSRFLLKDLKIFHSIVNSTSAIPLPAHMHFYEGNSRLRSSHLDHLSITSDISPRITVNYSSSHKEAASSSLTQFANSYFYRSMNLWNLLPLSTREISFPKRFETAVTEFLWDLAKPTPE